MKTSSEHLFQFELYPVETICPWSNSEGQLTLSLYILTDGNFKISAGNETLLQYTPEIISHWKLNNKFAEYTVACFARDILDAVSATVSPIPVFFEKLIKDESLFDRLMKCTSGNILVPSNVLNELEIQKPNPDFDDDHYNAFRWHGERSIWLNYLTHSPNISFIRIGNEIKIRWNNHNNRHEGINVWTTTQGSFIISVKEFIQECHSFSKRLLSEMETLIKNIENGLSHPKIPLDVESLRIQHRVFKEEFKKALSKKYIPDIEWKNAEKALKRIAHKCGIKLPTN